MVEIRRNDGLKTVSVLETVPVKALAMNEGLPIKVRPFFFQCD